MRTFTNETARGRINDAADCMLDAKRTLETVVRRFPAQADAFRTSFAKLDELYAELYKQANSFEAERPTATADVAGSPKVQAPCRLSA